MPTPKNNIDSNDLMGLLNDETPIRAPYSNPQGRNPNIIPEMKGELNWKRVINPLNFFVIKLSSSFEMILNPNISNKAYIIKNRPARIDISFCKIIKFEKSRVMLEILPNTKPKNEYVSVLPILYFICGIINLRYPGEFGANLLAMYITKGLHMKIQ